MNADLEKVRSFIYKRHSGRIAGLIAGRLLVVGLLLLLLIALLSVVFTMYPLTTLPFIFDGAIIVSALVAIGIVIDQLLLHRPDIRSTAKLCEQTASQQLPHPLLEIALELSSVKKYGELYDEVYRRAAEQIHTIRKIRNTSAFQRIRRFCIGTAFLLSGGVVLLLLTPDLFSYWQLPFAMLQKNDVTVIPGTVNIPKNSTIRLQLIPQGIPAPSCMVHCENSGRGNRITRLLRPDSNGVFSAVFDSLEESFVYQFIYGTKRCKPETVTVVPPPLLHDLHITLKPPAYTRLPPAPLPPGQGDFTAYSGTAAHFTLVSPGLLSAAIVYASDTVRLSVDDTIATGILMVKDGGTYSLSLQDTFMQRNDSSGLFSIGIINDEIPQVRFLRPGANKNLEPAEVETLLVEGSDDLGIKTVALYWCKNGKCTTGRESLDLSPSVPATIWQKQFIWKIFRLSLYPGDTLFYWATATDTKIFGQKQTATTDTFWFRFPTFEEMHRAMADRDRQASDLIGKVQRSQRELSQQVEQLDKAMNRPNTPAWDRRQLAAQVEKTMRAQADSLQEALHRLEENADKLRKEGALGEDLAKKMEEIQKAVRELVEQYGDSLLFPKNQSGDLSLDDMRQAVDKLQQMLPELGERLDNTLKFLEALKADRELAMLAMRAEKLAGEQAQLADGNKDPETAARQKDLLDRIDSLKENARKQSADNAQASFNESMQQIDSAGARMRNQLSRKQTPSPNAMRQMSGSLTSLAQQLREQMSSFRMQQMEALRNGLLDMTNHALSLASLQDEIRSNESFDEASRRKQARSQQALGEEIGFMKQELDSFPMLPPSLKQKLGSDINAADEASKAAVESMNLDDGSFGMKVSSHSLRQVAAGALAILDAMGRQDDGSAQSGGGGMQESLRKMSGKQSAINAATAQLLRAMLEGRKPGGESPGGEGKEGNGTNEQSRKEAQAAQQALADELKKLAEKFGDASGDALRNRIDELEKEARSLTRMLSEPREEVTEHQDRFLARMLQSALSLHREDEGKEERKSKSSGIVFSKTAGNVADSTSGRNDLFHLLRRQALLHGNYPPSYRSSINAYFDSLGVLYLK
jgi:hypothetical protein